MYCSFSSSDVSIWQKYLRIAVPTVDVKKNTNLDNKLEDILATNGNPEDRFTNSFLYVTKSTKTAPNEMPKHSDLSSKMENFAENSMMKTTEVESNSSQSSVTDIMNIPNMKTEPKSTSMSIITTQSATIVPADVTHSFIEVMTTLDTTKMASGSTMLETQSSTMMISTENKKLTVMNTTPANMKEYGTTESKGISSTIMDVMTKLPHTDTSNAIEKVQLHTTVSEKPMTMVEMTTSSSVEIQKSNIPYTTMATVTVENVMQTVSTEPQVATILPANEILPSTAGTTLPKTQETTEMILAAKSTMQIPAMLTEIPTAANIEMQPMTSTSGMEPSVTAVPVTANSANTSDILAHTTTDMMTMTSNNQQDTMQLKANITSLPQLMQDETTRTTDIENFQLATSTERKLASTMQHTEVSIMNTRSSADGNTMRMTTHSPVSVTTKRALEMEKMSNGKGNGSGSSNLSTSVVAVMAGIVFLCLANRSLVSTFYEICVFKM